MLHDKSCIIQLISRYKVETVAEQDYCRTCSPDCLPIQQKRQCAALCCDLTVDLARSAVLLYP